MAFPKLLELSLAVGAAVLAGLTWYSALMPYWAFQGGQIDELTFYSQGIGLWLNYTEHVGDFTFDPGNSLWVPPQPTGVDTYSAQCALRRTFCEHPIGELHVQYCAVVDTYCSPLMTILQLAMSLVAGLALLVLLWSALVLVTKHRTIVDHHLMHVCIFNGVTLLLVAMVWYLFVFRTVMDTTFYKDQYNRCQDNPTNRTCWRIGVCMYVAIAGAVLYPMLSVLIATHVTNKFRRFQRQLRKLHEEVTVVGLPVGSPLAVQEENVNTDTKRSTRLEGKEASSFVSSSSTISRPGTEIDLAAQRTLPSLKRIEVPQRSPRLQSTLEEDDEEEKVEEEDSQSRAAQASL